VALVLTSCHRCITAWPQPHLRTCKRPAVLAYIIRPAVATLGHSINRLVQHLRLRRPSASLRHLQFCLRAIRLWSAALTILYAELPPSVLRHTSMAPHLLPQQRLLGGLRTFLSCSLTHCMHQASRSMNLVLPTASDRTQCTLQPDQTNSSRSIALQVLALTKHLARTQMTSNNAGSMKWNR